jgi:tRNA U34 5-carboxymethylaminomethyl modifying enzyme MnmG/GidA
LLLRAENADLRLTQDAIELGPEVIDGEQKWIFEEKQRLMDVGFKKLKLAKYSLADWSKLLPKYNLIAKP